MPASTDSLHVALADDSGLFRHALAMLLESSGVTLIADCPSADELMPHVQRHVPDIVILDIQMPPGFSDEGIRAAAEIRRELPEIGILVLSTYDEQRYAADVMAIDTKSIGYLLKDRVTNGDALVDALERIKNGELVVDPHIVRKLLERPRRQPLVNTLSPAEREVLQLMAEGYSNTRISRELHLKVRTIEDVVSKILTKLGLPPDPDSNRRVQAVITWLRAL
jgi:DNA-binding NarL/FixJ family response regulator